MNQAADALRNIHLENDVVGVLLDCPKYASDVDADWFLDQLLGATVLYLQEHGDRMGLVKSLSEQFSKDISAEGIKVRLVQIRREARHYALVYLLPRYADRLEDLYERRQKLSQAEAIAREALAGVAVAV